MAQKTILITGTSSGIGFDAATHLASRGFHVLAGVRNAQDEDKLRAAHPNIEPVMLDVDVTDHVNGVVERIRRRGDGLFALINNAGFNLNAPFEHTDDRDSAALMRVNFDGVVRLSKTMIPLLRDGAAKHAKTTKLINISSSGGSFGVPWQAFYHASKFAVVGLTESIRHELWSQNIRAVVVQPGGIRTDFMPKTDASIARALTALPAGAQPGYAAGLKTLRARIAAAGRYGSSPAVVSKALEKIVSSTNPPCRVVVGTDAHLLIALQRWLPESWFHAIFRSAFGG
jgi:NAD(P)-dependent dehydrogenase (short-subunit alcohol dehydrogenase family)